MEQHARTGSSLVLVILAWLIAGCTFLPSSRTAIFDEAEYAPYAGEGPSSISGEAYITRTTDSVLVKCVGCAVFLTPATHYSTEWFERHVIDGQKLTQGDPRSYKYRRETTGTSEGRFAFDRLPAGDYYIACYTTWQVPGKPGKTTGAWAYSKGKVHLEAGEHKKVTLTNWHTSSVLAP
jgi:hypothetical protein